MFPAALRKRSLLTSTDLAPSEPLSCKRLRSDAASSSSQELKAETLSDRVYRMATPRINELIDFTGELPSRYQSRPLSPSISRPFVSVPDNELSYASDDWENNLVNASPAAQLDATPPSTPPRQLGVIQAPVISKKLKNRLPKEQRDPYIQNTIAIKERLPGLCKGDFPFKIKIGDKEVEIEGCQRFLGAGSYQDVYLVAGQGLISPEFVLKVPNEEFLAGVDGHIMIGLVGKDILHYPKIIRAFEDQESFRVARQYDMEILLENAAQANSSDPVRMVHGCRLVEYIPEAIPDGPMPELLQQRLKEFFAFCWKHKHLHLDVQKSNLHIDVQRIQGEIVDYQIVLIDPVHPQDAFKNIIDQTLESFAPKNSELHQFLDPRE